MGSCCTLSLSKWQQWLWHCLLRSNSVSGWCTLNGGLSFVYRKFCLSTILCDFVQFRTFRVQRLLQFKQEVIRVTREFKCCAGYNCCAGCDCCAMEIRVEAPIGQVCGYTKQTYVDYRILSLWDICLRSVSVQFSVMSLWWNRSQVRVLVIIIIIIISLTSIFFQDKSRVWTAASQQH